MLHKDLPQLELPLAIEVGCAPEDVVVVANRSDRCNHFERREVVQNLHQRQRFWPAKLC